MTFCKGHERYQYGIGVLLKVMLPSAEAQLFFFVFFHIKHDLTSLMPEHLSLVHNLHVRIKVQDNKTPHIFFCVVLLMKYARTSHS